MYFAVHSTCVSKMHGNNSIKARKREKKDSYAICEVVVYHLNIDCAKIKTQTINLK